MFCILHTDTATGVDTVCEIETYKGEPMCYQVYSTSEAAELDCAGYNREAIEHNHSSIYRVVPLPAGINPAPETMEQSRAAGELEQSNAIETAVNALKLAFRNADYRIDQTDSLSQQAELEAERAVYSKALIALTGEEPTRAGS